MKLTPAQKVIYDVLLWTAQKAGKGRMLGVYGDAGCGQTTVLKALHAKLGGAFLDMKDLLPVITAAHPLAMEESMSNLMLEALQKNERVFVDDLGLLCTVVGSCAYHTPRQNFINALMQVVVSYVTDHDRTLILAGSNLPSTLKPKWAWGIEAFQPEDYAQLCQTYLGKRAASQLDFPKVHRYAPGLNGYKLRSACEWLALKGAPTTEQFIDYLRTREMSSNVHLGDVEQVDLRSLQGIDSVIESLEANIVMPLENDELAQQLNLTARKGVLLVGPPGTGKTTIGKALAHRLKGKFFLVDGTVISGTQDFYRIIRRIFQEAEINSPSVVFLDDSDVIFQSGEELGLYRYLLTMLDGLEGKGGRVCLMMTAMDMSNVPPALVRSGRIELWLETKLPDARARTAILEERLARNPPPFKDFPVTKLVESTEGFTGADLKRLVEDAKTLYAYDLARKLQPTSLHDYFERAVETLQTNKKRYAEAEAIARSQRTVGNGNASSRHLAAMMAAGAFDADSD